MTAHTADKYSSKLDQVFVHGSYTDAFVNKKYDFDGVKTINVYTATTVALSNYDRTQTGDRFGGNGELQDVVTTYTLNNDKCFKLAIDRGNYEQGAFAKKAGEALRAQMDEKVIPAIDKDRIAAGAAGALAVSHNVSATSNAYADFLTATAYLNEAEAPMEGRVCFVTPSYYNDLKAKITTLMAPAANDKIVGRGVMGTLDGVTIVMCPSTYFPAGAKAVMWHKDALLGAKQINKTRIITDSEFVDGAVITGRFIFDSFVLNGKKNGVASIVGEGSI